MTDIMSVRVVDRGTGPSYEGVWIRTLTIPATCPTCGQRRGEPYPYRFREDGEWLVCDRWDNPCGHLDTYGALLASAKAERNEATLDATIAAHAELLAKPDVGPTDVIGWQAAEMLQHFGPKQMAEMLAIAVARLAGEQS